jgi:hypothetical protein
MSKMLEEKKQKYEEAVGINQFRDQTGDPAFYDYIKNKDITDIDPVKDKPNPKDPKRSYLKDAEAQVSNYLNKR